MELINQPKSANIFLARVLNTINTMFHNNYFMDLPDSEALLSQMGLKACQF